jgi:hypothetical protein
MTLLLVVAVLLLLAPLAWGATLGGFVGGATDGAGGLFTQPRDVAESASGAGAAEVGDHYVVESAGHRVSVLDADANFKYAFGRDVIVAGAGGDQGDVVEKCVVAADCKRGSTGTATDGPGGEFNNPQGVVIDQGTGDVYVLDRGNRRIQVFDAAGTFIRAFGWDVVQAGGSGDDASVPINEFEVCTVASECQAGSSGAGAGQFLSSSTNGAGLAISPVTGDVLASDPGNRRINQFDSGGNFLRAWGYGVDTGAAQFQVCTTASTCQAANPGASPGANGQFSNNSPAALAIDSQDVLYATDVSGGTSSNRIVRFDVDGAPASGDATANLLTLITPTGAGGPLLATATPAVGLEIDPDTDGGGPDEESLLALRDPNTPTSADTVVQELDIPTEAGELPTDAVTVAATHTFAAAAANGVGVSALTEYIYIPHAGSDPPGGPGQGLFVLAASPGAPGTPTVDPATGVGTTTAELSGSVDPNSGVVAYQFEVSSDGVSFSAVGRRYLSGSGSSSVSVTATGLAPNTIYQVRLRATKQTGLNTSVTVVSPEALFKTDAAPPTAVTLPATARRATSAELQATVNPNGSATTYRFEYGPTSNYGRSVPVPPASIGAGTADQQVALQVGSLNPGTVYHYRVVAQNAYGVANGSDSVFSTRAPAAPGGRGYELVSPPDKVSGRGVGVHLEGDGAASAPGFGARSGERYVAASSSGSPILDCPFEYANTSVLSERVSDSLGWASKCATNRREFGHAALRLASLRASSDNLNLFVWGSNGSHISVFPEVGDFPQTYAVPTLSDWGESWEVFGPTDTSQAAGVDGAFVDPGVVSADGSHVVLSSGLRGLSGPSDPTLDMPAPVNGHPAATYIDDVSAGLSDSFPGEGIRTPVGICDAGTELPSRMDAGGGTFKAAARSCPPPVEYAPGQFRDGALVDPKGASIGSVPERSENTQNTISEDGSRVFFMSPDPAGAPVACTGTAATTSCPPQLYVRQRNSDGSVVTRWISQSEVSQDNGAAADQDASLMARVRFEAATPDGDKVFFRTTAPLTADDPNGVPGAAPAGGVTTGTPSAASADLFMYDLPDGPDADPADGDLVRISRGPTGQADVNVSPGLASGSTRAVSADGGRVYFITSAPLAGVASPTDGTTTSPGGTPSSSPTNLYLYDSTGAGPQWRFIARLVGGGNAGACATTSEALSGLNPQLRFVQATNAMGVVDGGSCVRVSSDGGLLTFWTGTSLVANDPDDQAFDVYAYDADADELVRVSSPQDGEGGRYLCAPDGGVWCNGDGGIDAGALVRLGLVSEPASATDKTAFFQSRSRLVASDSDDEYDVYAWHNGDLELLSPDTAYPAYYTGNSADGEDVFVMTRQALTWQDTDGAMDIYDVRIGGGVPQPPSPVVCEMLAGACQDPGSGVSTPVQPKTSSLAGDGNVVSGNRKTLRVGKPSKKARRRAARTGNLVVSVRVSEAGKVSAVAKGRIGKRTRRVARKSVQVRKAGKATLRLRLNRAARQRLKSGRSLNLSIQVRSPGARSRSMSVRLPGGKS